jgi:hypothetical protein
MLAKLTVSKLNGSLCSNWKSKNKLYKKLLNNVPNCCKNELAYKKQYYEKQLIK